MPDCPRCDGPISPQDKICSHCGFVLASGPRPAHRTPENIPRRSPEPVRADDDLTCPHCGTRVYVGDPACATCGHPLCPRCGTAVDETADRCPDCGLELTFTCPGCGIELISGAEVCPDCGTVFTRRCPSCDEPLFRAPQRCPNCGQPVTHQARTTARSLSRRVGDHVVRADGRHPWAVCPVCGANFLPSTGPCPACGTHLCPQCNLLLVPEETTCPRCGIELGPACPHCGAGVEPGAPECPACGQPLCPDCGAAIGENDTICATCGAELALLCSECGKEVSPDDTTCPHCGAQFEDPLPPILARQESSDGETRKNLLQLADGEQIEVVLLRYRERRSGCISTQVGCACGCRFCATGQMGFRRDLTSAEIIAQVLHMQRELATEHRQLSNVVLMGMGEPLLNYEHTLAAIRRLIDPRAVGLPQRRITLSTVGIVPGIERLIGENLRINLAISLHAATDSLRSQLVPINQRYPLDDLFAVLRSYTAHTQRHVMLEWIMIDGVTDTPAQAQALVQRLAGLPAHVNLIRLNPTADYPERPSTPEAIDAFTATLDHARIPHTMRQRRGADIAAGCGQLRSQR